MGSKPPFFDAVQQKAAQRWHRLDGDPEDAGVWNMLFRQVQSPRHVLSELLQNADDAGATEASVWIENQTFIFEHNGRDFSQEDFASLCRFAYSNKRVLHTIGFRGIGFKSTFSLGDPVKIFTPSLSVCFHRRRFTEPHWLQETVDTLGKTRIVVEMHDQNRQEEFEKNLQDWCKSPVSLLFCNNIREIKIRDQRLCWDSQPGPIEDSKWMVLNEDEDKPHLLIRSDDEPFPDEALEEIRQERMLDSNEEFEPPQCKIEIVLGEEATGDLYVVLPTGVATGLPFTCNAPFIQDPSRLKIKDLETSPTNRWLLQRAGKLAALAMLEWLNDADMDIAECARAYDLFPSVNQNDNSLGSTCGALVQKIFNQEIQNENLLLTDDNRLSPAKESIAIPEDLFKIWSPDVATEFLDERKRPALCRHIAKDNRKKLVAWDLLEELGDAAVIKMLETKIPPKPNTWPELLNLWVYISPKVKDYYYHGNLKDIHIVPVQGEYYLYSSKKVVRLGKEKLLQSSDREFLIRHLRRILDQSWLDYLKQSKSNEDKLINTTVRDTYAVLNNIGLGDASDVDKVIGLAADELFSQDRVSLEECVQIAHIAAKLNADITKLSSEFKYMTRDMYRRSSKEDEFILFDKNDTLEDLLPSYWRETKLLHKDYSNSFKSCSQDEWEAWITSGRASLLTCIPLIKMGKYIRGDDELEKEAEEHDVNWKSLYFPYVGEFFILKSWDFDETYWDHWYELTRDNEELYVKVAKSMFTNCKYFLDKYKNTELFQISNRGNVKSMMRRRTLSSWVLKLRQFPCLPDRKGLPRKPDDLFRLTPETEPLIGVEDFVEASMDNEQTRPLLDLMGVRTTPRGPDRLLDRLRELSRGTVPFVNYVDELYKRLDRMLSQSSTEDSNSNMIKQAFQSERLILTENSGWQMLSNVFRTSGEEDMPDVKIIRNTVNSLTTLWQHVGVAEKPTRDDAVRWLRNLPENSVLNANNLRYMHSLLTRYPDYIWRECGQWCNLAGEWASVDHLSWSTRQPLVCWEHLYSWVKKKTADLRFLSQETVDHPSFSHLLNLATIMEDRLDNANLECDDRVDPEEWLTILGRQLCRVKLNNDDDTQRIRTLANRLTQIRCHKMQVLKTVPHINGQPAGDPRQRDVLWIKDDLFYVDQPRAKLAKLIPEEVGREFGLENIKAALHYSFRRSAQDVREYAEQNFKLCPVCPVSEETPGKVEGPPPSELQEPKPTSNGGEPRGEPDENPTRPQVEPPVTPPRRHPPNPDRPRIRPPRGPRVPSDNHVIADRAREIIMYVERWLRFKPVDRESERGLGYDIESRVPGTETLRFIEVKGRSADSSAPINVTRNEIICSLNNPDKFILAIVEFNENTNDCKVQVDYLREPFLCKPDCKPDCKVVSVSYDLDKLRKDTNMEDTERITFNDERIILPKNLYSTSIDTTYYCTLNLTHRDIEELCSFGFRDHVFGQRHETETLETPGFLCPVQRARFLCAPSAPYAAKDVLHRCLSDDVQIPHPNDQRRGADDEQILDLHCQGNDDK
ncbi:MAG: DUF3883 domain-containing protein [Cyanobacteria bacterium MAG CAR1_bin_15]|nr:DUF3883 domain-containing protein [Cyanobacteria bacterium MAG CAR1_bin_15]